MKFLALGAGAVIGWAAWRNVPPMPGRSNVAAVGFLLILAAAAYVGWRRRPNVSATATATAVASAQARAQQVLVVNVNEGARNVSAQRWGGLDGDVEWRGGLASAESAALMDAVEDGEDVEDAVTAYADSGGARVRRPRPVPSAGGVGASEATDPPARPGHPDDHFPN